MCIPGEHGESQSLAELISECDRIANALDSPLLDKLTTLSLQLRNIGDQLTRLADCAAVRLALDKAIAESYTHPK